MNESELDYRLGCLIREASESDAALHRAAGTVREQRVRDALLERASTYARAAETLRAIGRAMGRPARHAVEQFVDRRAAAAGADEVSILADCERREDLTVVAFRDVLELPLPEAMRALLVPEFDRMLGRLTRLRAPCERIDRHRDDRPPGP
jgi:uncharacterized protein (TIGR02284 family)